MMATKYFVIVACDDMGEYDGTFLGECAARVSEVLGASGIVGFTLTTARQRKDEAPPE